MNDHAATDDGVDAGQFDLLVADFKATSPISCHLNVAQVTNVAIFILKMFRLFMAMFSLRLRVYRRSSMSFLEGIEVSASGNAAVSIVSPFMDMESMFPRSQAVEFTADNGFRALLQIQNVVIRILGV